MKLASTPARAYGCFSIEVALFPANQDNFSVKKFDEFGLVERTYGAFEGLFAHVEPLGDFFGRAVVGKGQAAACGLQLVEQDVGKVSEAVHAEAAAEE